MSVEKTAGVLLERAKPVAGELLLADMPSFNIFNTLGDEREEHIHSRILFRLLSGADGFLRLLLERLGLPEPDGKWAVYREYAIPGGRIDFVLESAKFFLALEVKIDAEDQGTQLERYNAFCQSRNKDYFVCYLTLEGAEPSEQSTGNMDRSKLRLLSFQRDIAGWLTDCLALTEAGGFKHSYITQYLGVIRHLTEGDLGMAKTINFIQSAEDARAALLIYESFQQKIEDVISGLMEGLTEALEEKTGQTVYLTVDRLGKFYNAAHPFLYTEIASVRKKAETCRLVAGVGIEPSYFYGYFQFCRGEISDPEFLSLAEAREMVPAFYTQWMENIAGLDLPFVRAEKNSKYFELENSKGEHIAFRVNTPPNQAALDLIDHLDTEVEYISNFITHRMILPILPDKERRTTL